MLVNIEIAHGHGHQPGLKIIIIFLFDNVFNRQSNTKKTIKINADVVHSVSRLEVNCNATRVYLYTTDYYN